MIDAKNARYALWLMPGLGDDPTEGVTQLAPDIVTWRGDLGKCIKLKKLSPWKDGIGSLAWDRLTASNRRLVIAWAPYGNAKASDKALNERIDTAQLALMLASDHCRYNGHSQVLMGEAATIEPGRLNSVNGYGERELGAPHYLGRDAFWNGYGNHGKRKALFLTDPWFRNWLEWTKTLDALTTRPDLLGHAVYKFNQAYRGPFLEFRLILYVRTAEFVLGLPAYKPNRPKNAPRPGAKTFAERALRIAPELSTHWYVKAKNIHERFMQVYRHRNACAHGLIPFENMVRDSEGGSDEAARIEFIAEYLARACLRIAIAHPDAAKVFASRDTLEAAWEGGTFP